MEPKNEREFIKNYAKASAWIFLVLSALTLIGIVLGAFINNQTT